MTLRYRIISEIILIQIVFFRRRLQFELRKLKKKKLTLQRNKYNEMYISRTADLFWSSVSIMLIIIIYPNYYLNHWYSSPMKRSSKLNIFYYSFYYESSTFKMKVKNFNLSFNFVDKLILGGFHIFNICSDKEKNFTHR